MPKIFAFSTTQCYTRGVTPDTVSMDYVFVEADDNGDALDSIIWLETWDMPLPQPQVIARALGTSIDVEIVMHGWFFPGKTTIELSDKNAEITHLTVSGERRLKVTTTKAVREGVELTFTSRNEFYFHRGTAIVTSSG